MQTNEDVLSAVREKDLETLDALLEEHPEWVETRDPNGVSLLLYAVYCNNTEAVELIRARREKLDVFEASAIGEMDTLAECHERDAGAFRRIAPDGFTAVHLAAFFRRLAALEFILEHGGDANLPAAAPSMVRPIHSAAASRDADAVCLVLQHGADPDLKQQGGHTALHAAVLHNNVPMVEVLLSGGADLTVPNDEGQTAIDIAEKAQDAPDDTVLKLLRTAAPEEL